MKHKAMHKQSRLVSFLIVVLGLVAMSVPRMTEAAGYCWFACFVNGTSINAQQFQPPSADQTFSCNALLDCTADQLTTYCHAIDPRADGGGSNQRVCIDPSKPAQEQVTGPSGAPTQAPSAQSCVYTCYDKNTHALDQTNFRSVNPIACVSDGQCRRDLCNNYCHELDPNSSCGTDPVGSCVKLAPLAAPSTGSAGSAPSAPATKGSPTTLTNPLSTTDFRVIFGRIARAFIGIVGAFALLMYILGGVMWMTAADSKRVETAKALLVNSTIGILLIFFAYFISVAFLALFGISV